MGVMSPPCADAVIDSFAGRFQTTSGNCLFSTSLGRDRGCRLIEINGRSPTIISIRFIGAGDEPGSSQRLTFVVSTSEETPLLQCKRGSCKLETASWVGSINSVSEATYDADGLAESVPKAWSAGQGSCRLSSGRLSCQAETPGGGQLSAEAQL